MKTRARFTLIASLALLAALSLLAAGLTLAQPGLERPREVLGAGASDSAADSVSLRGTLGQPLVGVISSSGGEVTLGQGFWHGAAQYRTYLPLVFRDYS